VRLDRGDGFSFDEHLVVCADRSALARFNYRPSNTGPRCRTFAVPTSMLRRLGLLLKQADFKTLRPTYLSRPAPSEVVTYTVTYRGRRVKTDGPSLTHKRAPVRFARVVRALNAILDPQLQTPLNRTRKNPRRLPRAHRC
jgi:hypothetical protein